MGSAFRLRGYTIETLLGTGASGDVWRARVAGTGEPVAVKRIPTVDAEQARRAQAEAALLTVLDHPHLVRLHAFVPTADASVLVLDLADGGTLAGLLAARGRLTPGEVITAVAPVAAALAYLHGEGVVHGDVSAANVLFTGDGIPMLADVGMARLTGDDSEVACTPAYVDPAVAAGCVPGPQSDVFMLAAVALHALTGVPAWRGESSAAALAAAATGNLGDVAARLRSCDVPDAMIAVLDRALTIDPHRRGTAADLALDLRHSGEPVAVELAAGRERPAAVPDVWSGPRHAAWAQPHSSGVAPVVATNVGASDRARPSFERPSSLDGAACGPGAPPPTRMVGPRPRPVIPRPQRGIAGRLAAGGVRRRLVILLVSAVVALLAAGGTVWARTRTTPPAHRADRTAPARSHVETPTRSSTRPPTRRPSHASTSRRSASSPASRTPVTRPPSGPPGSTRAPGDPDVVTAPLPTSTAAARRVLEALDTIRARAFRTRDPTLLTDVYADASLRNSDADLVRRIVPAGCGLTGVRTRFGDVRLSGSARRGQVVVTVVAVLPSTHVVCAGQARGTAAASGPTRLRIELVRVGRRVEIADQRLV